MQYGSYLRYRYGTVRGRATYGTGYSTVATVVCRSTVLFHDLSSFLLRRLMGSTSSRFMRHEAWEDALFVHYTVDAEKLQTLLPKGLEVDLFDGVAYIGIVLLTESGIVPWPPRVPVWLVRCLGISHHAVNVRTYVRTAHGPPGIYFFTLECSALLPVLGARSLFNLPYRYSRISRWDGSRQTYHLTSRRVGADPRVMAEWRTDDTAENDGLGRFVVERECTRNLNSCLLVPPKPNTMID